MRNLTGAFKKEPLSYIMRGGRGCIIIAKDSLPMKNKNIGSTHLPDDPSKLISSASSHPILCMGICIGSYTGLHREYVTDLISSVGWVLPSLSHGDSHHHRQKPYALIGILIIIGKNRINSLGFCPMPHTQGGRLSHLIKPPCTPHRHPACAQCRDV